MYIFCFSEIYSDAKHQSPQLEKRNIFSSDKTSAKSADKGNVNRHSNGKGDARTLRKQGKYTELSSSSGEDSDDDDRRNSTSRKDGSQRSFGLRNRKGAENGLHAQTTRNSNAQVILPFSLLQFCRILVIWISYWKLNVGSFWESWMMFV